MRTMLDVSNDICGAMCPTSKPSNGLDAKALQAVLAACPADAVEQIAALKARVAELLGAQETGRLFCPKCGSGDCRESFGDAICKACGKVWAIPSS